MMQLLTLDLLKTPDFVDVISMVIRYWPKKVNMLNQQQESKVVVGGNCEQRGLVAYFMQKRTKSTSLFVNKKWQDLFFDLAIQFKY